jgi:SLOG family YspA-like protein
MTAPADVREKDPSAMITVLVTGGRNYTNRDEVFTTLNDLHAQFGIARIVHGACRVDRLRQNWSDLSGADKFADAWARTNDIECIPYPAEFSLYGRLKGARKRDRDMFDLSKPDIVLAFPGNAGTRNCCAIAKARGIRLLYGGESG